MNHNLPETAWILSGGVMTSLCLLLLSMLLTALPGSGDYQGEIKEDDMEEKFKKQLCQGQVIIKGR